VPSLRLRVYATSDKRILAHTEGPEEAALLPPVPLLTLRETAVQCLDESSRSRARQSERTHATTLARSTETAAPSIP
jgi:hypothetical protein